MQMTTRVNYDELLPISKKLHDEGEDFAQLLSATRQKMAALRTEWEGEAADKFFDEMETSLLPAIKKLSQGLIISQEVLHKIMRTIHEADQETGTFFRDGGSGGEDFGAGKFNDALGGLGVAGGIAAGAGGEDFGAGLFNQAGGESGTPGASGPGTGADSGSGGPSETTDHFTPDKKDMEPFATTESETGKPEETPPAESGAGGGGGGGGAGVSGQGLQGNLDGMGSGLGSQPASNAFVGGSSAGAEGLPDHIFGGGGSSGGGGSGLSQGGGGSAGGGSAGGESGASGDGGVAAGVAGVAGVAGSAAVGGAAKVIKSKQDDNG